MIVLFLYLCGMIHRLVSWTKAICRFLAKVLCTLAMPIRHNWVFVLMMLLMLSLCIWREWIYQVDTALHYWHFCFDIYLLCIFLMLFRHNIRRYVKFLLYGIAYLSTFFEILDKRRRNTGILFGLFHRKCFLDNLRAVTADSLHTYTPKQT